MLGSRVIERDLDVKVFIAKYDKTLSLVLDVDDGVLPHVYTYGLLMPIHVHTRYSFYGSSSLDLSSVRRAEFTDDELELLLKRCWYGVEDYTSPYFEGELVSSLGIQDIQEIDRELYDYIKSLHFGKVASGVSYKVGRQVKERNRNYISLSEVESRTLHGVRYYTRLYEDHILAYRNLEEYYEYSRIYRSYIKEAEREILNSLYDLDYAKHIILRLHNQLDLDKFGRPYVYDRIKSSLESSLRDGYIGYVDDVLNEVSDIFQKYDDLVMYWYSLNEIVGREVSYIEGLVRDPKYYNDKLRRQVVSVF